MPKYERMLAPFVQGQEETFRNWCRGEASRLVQVQFGEPIVHTLGYLYTRKGEAEAGKSKLLGIPTVVEKIREVRSVVGLLLLLLLFCVRHGAVVVLCPTWCCCCCFVSDMVLFITTYLRQFDWLVMQRGRLFFSALYCDHGRWGTASRPSWQQQAAWWTS